MQNYVGVAILTQTSFRREYKSEDIMLRNSQQNFMLEQMKKLDFLVGNSSILEEIRNVPALPAFSEQVIYFLDELSKHLRKNPETKNYTDVLSWAFWIRRASVEKEKENHILWEKRMGRGVAYHIAPSNVPVNFAVSMTSALLAGNACVIRVSNKDFVQVKIICEGIKELLGDKCKEMKDYLCIVRYEHDAEVTQMLSNLCDVRIIWGGDRTIQIIREAQLPPRAIEMAFSDRYSIAVIHADNYLEQNAQKVAKDFYTDTYYSDQNACSSPRIVIWLGEKKEEAQKRFWRTLEQVVHQEYQLHPIQVVDKLNAFCLLAAKNSLQNSKQISGDIRDNYLYRIEVPEITSDIMQYKEAGGYFFEYKAEQLEEIVPILSKTCQTVATLGVSRDEVETVVQKFGVRGVDRIVPIGKTMELSFRWDGYDMIETMSRVVG